MILLAEMNLEMLCLVLMMSWRVSSVDPQSGGTVLRLQSLQDELIQPGLSFINSSNMGSVSMMDIRDIHNLTTSHHLLSASVNVVNWSRWLLGYPVYYFKYGHFKQGRCGKIIILIILWKFDNLNYIGKVIG